MSSTEVKVNNLPSSVKRSFDMFLSGEPLKETDVFRLRFTGLVQIKKSNEIVLTRKGEAEKSKIH